jgi:MFS family permease
MMNLARVPGQILLGHLSDKMSARPLILLVCVCSSVTTFSWGAAETTPGILLFSTAFGGIAGSYTALFPRFIASVAQDNNLLPPILYSMFSCKLHTGTLLI